MGRTLLLLTDLLFFLATTVSKSWTWQRLSGDAALYSGLHKECYGIMAVLMAVLTVMPAVQSTAALQLTFLCCFLYTVVHAIFAGLFLW